MLKVHAFHAPPPPQSGVSCLHKALSLCPHLEGEVLLANEGHGPARNLFVAHVPPRLPSPRVRLCVCVRMVVLIIETPHRASSDRMGGKKEQRAAQATGFKTSNTAKSTHKRRVEVGGIKLVLLPVVVRVRRPVSVSVSECMCMFVGGLGDGARRLSGESSGITHAASSRTTTPTQIATARGGHSYTTQCHAMQQCVARTRRG